MTNEDLELTNYAVTGTGLAAYLRKFEAQIAKILPYFEVFKCLLSPRLMTCLSFIRNCDCSQFFPTPNLTMLKSGNRVSMIYGKFERRSTLVVGSAQCS